MNELPQTTRQWLILLLTEAGRADAAALLPVQGNCNYCARLDYTPASRPDTFKASAMVLYSFRWDHSGINPTFWANLYYDLLDRDW